jgi:hypothetical protein
MKMKFNRREEGNFKSNNLEGIAKDLEKVDTFQ